MNELVIFYSWQNDTPTNHNRYLIRDTLNEVISDIGQDLKLETAPRLDHDTKDVPGFPEITSTIFNKIDDCSVFVADVTFVQRISYNAEGEKGLPNPNVMIELGYAIKSLGPNRVILVFNDSFGGTTLLPFNLKHRRFPITYTLPSEANKDQQQKAMNSLAGELKRAVRMIVEKNPEDNRQRDRDLRIRINPTRDGRKQLAQIRLFNSGLRPIYVSTWFVSWGVDGEQSGSHSGRCVQGKLPYRLEEQSAHELLVDISGNPIEHLKSIGVFDGEDRLWKADESQIQHFIHVAMQHQLPPLPNAPSKDIEEN